MGVFWCEFLPCAILFRSPLRTRYVCVCVVCICECVYVYRHITTKSNGVRKYSCVANGKQAVIGQEIGHGRI